MSFSGNTTVPSPTEDVASAAPRERLVRALAFIWNEPQPFRVGEVGLLDFTEHSSLLLARTAHQDDGPASLVRFVRQEPGGSVYGGPLSGDTLSRRQTAFFPVPGGLEVQNLAKGMLLLDGHRVETGTRHRIRPGTVLQIRGHSNLLFVMRPAVLPAARGPLVRHTLGQPDLDGIAGESAAAWALRAALAAAVRTRGTVLLHGQTGTGKECAAHALHRMSGRRGPLIIVNCANLEKGLADAELFGNLANYPQHGMEERPGLLGAAAGGTLFLDEIGELAPELQSKLLRALEGEYTRLGESRARKADALLVAATNRDLSVLKADVLKRFGFVVELPSLAERMEDVALIARALILREHRKNSELTAPFVAEDAAGRPYVRMTAAFSLAMQRASYDGNVRDLNNLLVRAMTETTEGPLHQPEDMRPWRAPPTLPPPVPVDDLEDLAKHQAECREAEQLVANLAPTPEQIRIALEKHGWHQVRTAEALGVDRYQLRRWMLKLDIRRP